MRKRKHLYIHLLLQQEHADKVARDYNTRYNPLKHALRKGLTNLIRTDNGGVSFISSPYIYKINENPICIEITATGSRSKDFKYANKLCGFSETPPGYTWHHLDDYNVTTNTFTLELVLRWAHRATTPHSGGCAMYKAATGHCYK